MRCRGPLVGRDIAAVWLRNLAWLMKKDSDSEQKTKVNERSRIRIRLSIADAHVAGAKPKHKRTFRSCRGTVVISVAITEFFM
jgi:hypothetical protein